MRTEPLDLSTVEPYLQICGQCDLQLGAPCTCPPGDIRAVLLDCVEEIERLRRTTG